MLVITTDNDGMYHVRDNGKPLYPYRFTEVKPFNNGHARGYTKSMVYDIDITGRITALMRLNEEEVNGKTR